MVGNLRACARGHAWVTTPPILCSFVIESGLGQV